MLNSLQSLFRVAKKSPRKKKAARAGRRLSIESLETRMMLAAAALTPLPQLQVSDNGRYIVQEDGTPFYWQSDDGWAVNTRLDFDVTVPGTGKNEVDYYLDTRAAQGFTVIHTWLIPSWQTTNTEGDAPFVGSLNNGNPVVLNTPFFDNVDQIAEEAESRGLYYGIELGQVLRTSPSNLWLGGFDAGNNAQDHAAHEAKAYELGWKVADALRDRSNIIWGFGQDTVPSRADRVGTVNAANNGVKYVDLVRAMAEGVADATNVTAGTTFNSSTFDASANYDTTLMSFHVGATRDTANGPEGASSAEWFNNDEWLDFNMNQGGRRERFFEEWYDLVADNYNLNPTKPIFEAEALYEGWGVPFDTLAGEGTSYDTRVSAYWSTFAGDFGNSYGNLSTIYLHNNARYAPRGNPPVGGSVADWWDEINSPGAQDMVHAKNLLASRPFLSHVPNQNLLSTGASVSYQRLVATGNSDGSYALIYSTNGRSFDVDLSEMSGTTLNAWWYSPRDGNVYDNSGSEVSSPFETFSNTGNAGDTKNFNPPGSANGATASTGNDWVLVLDDASKSYAIPGTAAAVLGADFDFDNDVDGDDLAIWQTGFSTGTSQAQGDANLDGDVDGADFLAWQRGFTGSTQQQEVITLEGEAATPAAGSSFAVGSDSNASGGQYLSASSSNTGSPDLSDYAELTYTVTTAGTYRIRGSVLSPSSSQNSFWVQVDNGPIWKWHTPSDTPTQYRNVYVTDEGTENPPVEVELAVGERTVRLYSRDKNTRLDTLALEIATAILPLTSVDIVPHRGGRTIYPENTLYANTRNLVDKTSLDLDIRKTGDGDIVVIHDTTTNRTTQSNLTVANSTVTQLQTLDAAYKFDPTGNSSFPLRGQGVTIPTLDAVLAEFKANQQPGAFLWIDLKDDSDFTIAQNQSLFDRLIELIGNHNLWNEAKIEVASTAVGDELLTRDSRIQVVFWNSQVSSVLAALSNPNFGTIGVPLSIANQVADAVHAAGKKLHVTSGSFSTSDLYGLQAANPDSLGIDDYTDVLDDLGLNSGGALGAALGGLGTDESQIDDILDDAFDQEAWDEAFATEL